MRVVPVVREPEQMNVGARIENRAEEPHRPKYHRRAMVIVVVVPFLNEERYLGETLTSIARQHRRPDLLLLVDDGSTDRSGDLAQEFAAQHAFAKLLRRPPRPPEGDRLAAAAELKAFQYGVGQIEVPYDIVVKLDGDLELRPSHIAEMERRFQEDPKLGIAGSYLNSWRADGRLKRERFPQEFVLGPNKFYRRQCMEEISPLPAILGWDGLDVVRARMRGWRTGTFELPDGDSIHLRPTGSHDGRLRAYRRWGLCAYAVGTHPLTVLAGTLSRAAEPPYVIGGVNYLAGWLLAGVRRAPRAEPEARAFKRREDLQRLRQIISSVDGPSETTDSAASSSG